MWRGSIATAPRAKTNVHHMPIKDQQEETCDVRYKAQEPMKTLTTVFFSLLFLLSTTVSVYAQGIEWEILDDEVKSLSKKGQYDRAVVVAKKALEVAEKAFGSNHLNVATSLNNLAELYRTQGQYAQAE